MQSNTSTDTLIELPAVPQPRSLTRRLRALWLLLADLILTFVEA